MRDFSRVIISSSNTYAPRRPNRSPPNLLNMSENQQLEKGIKSPHDHDVLSGRGNFVNYHAGNEYFRGLVRKHKIAYIACPKPQKGKFSRIIVDEIRMREPPGRFLKQDLETKLWYDIGDKKALDKTRQALREGAPELLKDIDQDDEEDEEEFEPTSCVVNQVRSETSHSFFCLAPPCVRQNTLQTDNSAFEGTRLKSVSLFP